MPFFQYFRPSLSYKNLIYRLFFIFSSFWTVPRKAVNQKKLFLPVGTACWQFLCCIQITLCHSRIFFHKICSLLSDKLFLLYLSAWKGAYQNLVIFSRFFCYILFKNCCSIWTRIRSSFVRCAGAHSLLILSILQWMHRSSVEL